MSESFLLLQGFGRVCWRHSGHVSLLRGRVNITSAPWLGFGSETVMTMMTKTFLTPVGKQSWCSSTTRSQASRKTNIRFLWAWRRYSVCMVLVFLLCCLSCFTKWNRHIVAPPPPQGCSDVSGFIQAVLGLLLPLGYEYDPTLVLLVRMPGSELCDSLWQQLTGLLQGLAQGHTLILMPVRRVGHSGNLR